MSEPRWTYAARLTRQGGPVVDLVLVDPAALPDGVPSYDTRGEAKAGRREHATIHAPRTVRRRG